MGANDGLVAANDGLAAANDTQRGGEAENWRMFLLEKETNFADLQSPAHGKERICLTIPIICQQGSTLWAQTSKAIRRKGDRGFIESKYNDENVQLNYPYFFHHQ